MSRKINQEQLKIDRKLAWERVNELLGGSDDDDDESEVKDKEKPGKKTLTMHFIFVLANNHNS